ncbi:MAG TPA: twitching motility protein PilT [Thermoplasmata archaeon]|nr:twitching motility protein PilT [Thermoplasmata archaeon]
MAPSSGRPVVLVDANALLLPFTSHFRLEEEIYAQVDGARILIPASVLGELERVAHRGNVQARAAREFARRFDIVPTEALGDDALVELGRRLTAWVLTGDRALRTRLLEAGVRVLFPRGKSHLDRAVSPRPPVRAPRPKQRHAGKR